VKQISYMKFLDEVCLLFTLLSPFIPMCTTRFYIEKLSILPTECRMFLCFVCVCVCVSETKQILFPDTTLTVSFFVTTVNNFVYCAVRNESLYVLTV
jgi:hypothetical protein